MQAPSNDRSGTPVGIIGGGQLAMMLAEAALELGLAPRILAQSPKDPALQVAGVIGDVAPLSDADAIARLLARADVVAFESEFTSPDVIARAVDMARAAGRASEILPTGGVMAVCGDKLRQKLALRELGVPSAEFDALARDEASVDGWLDRLERRFPGGFVLKWAKGGYDGKGTLVCRRGKVRDAARVFIGGARASGADVYAEALIDFTSELAVISTRSTSGELAQYPGVLTVQAQNVCNEVRGPAAAFGATPEALASAGTSARLIGERLGIVGTFAVEFLVERGGAVLVNEIAPRVHNSGHFSQDAAATSQFANHWLALLGRPLGSTATAPFFGMVNLLGPEGVDGPMQAAFAAKDEGVVTHWYGKTLTRPGRKLGHVNVLASSRGELAERMQRVQSAVTIWHNNLRNKEA